MNKTPGQAAYERWQYLTPQAPNTAWESIPEAGKQGWEEVAKAAIEAWKLKDTENVW